MAFTFISTAEFISDSSNSATVTKPSGTVDGDIMFAFSGRRNVSGTPTSVPAGWTSLGTEDIYAAYYKVASSEPANYTWGYDSFGRTKVVISTFRGGFNISDPIVASSNLSYTISNSILRAGGVTTLNNNSPLIFLGGMVATIAGVSSTPNTGYTQHYGENDIASDMFVCISSKTFESSGETGDVDSIVSIASPTKHAYLIALTPDIIEGGGNSNFFMFM